MSERAVLTDSRRRLSLQQSGILNHSSNNNNDPFSPLIVMSGYVVKRTRGFTTKWQKRYWQLLGDGALIYFSGDHRLKVLGEIDIAHTCYEVRHGSENCDVKFPSAVPPNCCFSVAVLKRTYYFYTFKEEETEKWVQALNSTSYLINRLRPRRLNCNPAVQVAIKALHETSPDPPATQPPPSQHKPPPPPPPIPPYNPVGDSSSEENDNGLSELPSFSKMTHGGRRNMSVPDLRFNSSITHNGSWIDGSPRIRSSSTATPPSPLTLSSAKKQNMQHQQRRKKRVVCSPQFSDIQTQSPTYENVATFKPQRYMSQGNLLFEDTQMEFKTLPSPARLNKMKQKWKSAYDVQWSPAFERLEELQQKEDAIRKRIEEMKRFESFSQLPYHGGVHVLPTLSSPSIENIPLMSLSQHAPYNEKTELPPISPAYHSQPNPPEFIPPSALRKTSVETPTVKKTKTAPKVSPKPISGRRLTPAPVFSQSVQKPNKEGNNNRTSARILEDSRENFAILEDINEEENIGIDTSKSINASAGDAVKGGMKKSKSETKSLDRDSNIWVKKEMLKLIEEIIKVGYRTSNGQIEVKFGVLLDATEGLFEAFLGTLLTARKYKVIHFDGEILLKGANDNTPITLLQTEI